MHYFGLDPSAVGGAIVAFVIVHGLAQDVLGRSLDYTLQVATMLQTALNIPNNTKSTAVAKKKQPAKGGKKKSS